MKVLVVVDMQKDFIEGPLGNEETRAIVPNVVKRVKEAIENGEEVWYTFDSHDEHYLDTIEGRHLPIPHCIVHTDGWELVDELNTLAEKYSSQNCISKTSFGCYQLPEMLANNRSDEITEITDITLIGVCTDICVVSNALVLKAYASQAEIHVDASCCAGTTPENHEAALQVMKSCQIIVEGE